MKSRINYPQISVIIPTYNRAHLIGRAIQSVLNQTYQNFEVIIVDDGSTDNTRQVVKSFNDPRIHYIRHIRNCNVAVARNTGIKVSKGRYIAFQDSDDEWLPEKLDAQMRVFEKSSPEIGLVYTQSRKMKNDGKQYTPYFEMERKDGIVYNDLLKGNFIDTPTVVMRRECFDKVGMFDERFLRFEDWELWIRVSKYYRFRYIRKPLVNCYYSSRSISSNIKASIKARTLILKKNFEEIKKNRKLLGNYLYSIGIDLCLCNEINNGRKYILKTFQVFPLSIKFFLMGFFSFFGPRCIKKIIRLRKYLGSRNKGLSLLIHKL